MAYHEIDGALFKDEQRPADGKRYPIMHLALEVLGVNMNVAVWPAEKSKGKGVTYWPCSGDYARGETRRLVPVDVAGVRIKYTNDVAAGPVDAPAPQPSADPDTSTPIPF